MWYLKSVSIIKILMKYCIYSSNKKLTLKSQTLCVDKIGFGRLDHIYLILTIYIAALTGRQKE